MVNEQFRGFLVEKNIILTSQSNSLGGDQCRTGSVSGMASLGTHYWERKFFFLKAFSKSSTQDTSASLE